MSKEIAIATPFTGEFKGGKTSWTKGGQHASANTISRDHRACGKLNWLPDLCAGPERSCADQRRHRRQSHAAAGTSCCGGTGTTDFGKIRGRGREAAAFGLHRKGWEVFRSDRRPHHRECRGD